MYAVTIRIHVDQLSEAELKTKLEAHRAWFTRYFEAGNFLLVGPFRDQFGTGMILAKTETREALDAILAEDAFYAEKLADYEVHEWIVNLVNPEVVRYQGQ